MMTTTMAGMMMTMKMEGLEYESSNAQEDSPLRRRENQRKIDDDGNGNVDDDDTTDNINDDEDDGNDDDDDGEGEQQCVGAFPANYVTASLLNLLGLNAIQRSHYHHN